MPETAGQDEAVAGLEAITRALEEATSVVLTTHVTPDGDGLGAALALSRHLRRRGKAATIINCSSAPHDLRWMYDRGEFHVYNGGKHEKKVVQADAVVATDIGGSERLGKMMDAVKRCEGTRIVIDHHIYDNDMFDLALIRAEASSSAEITYDLLRHMGATIDRSLAEPLYVGLVSDTGGFAYSATSPRAHTMASHLLEAGVDPQRVWRQMQCQVPASKMRFLGLLLSTLRYESDDRIVWAAVDLEFLREHHTAPRDAFEIVNHFLRVKGVEVGAFFMEISKTRTKVSLRSAGNVDVCPLAKAHGGGGHRFAAGCTVDGKGLDDAIPYVLGALAALLPEGEDLDTEEAQQP